MPVGDIYPDVYPDAYPDALGIGPGGFVKGLRFALEADDGRVTVVSGKVSVWRDSSNGVKHDHSQGTDANRPDWNQVQLNGYKTVTFSDEEYLETPADSDLDVGTGSWLWWAVLNRDQVAGFRIMYLFGDHASADHHRIYLNSSNNPLLVWGNDAQAYASSDLVFPDDAWALLIVGVDSDAGEVIYRVNSLQERISQTIQGNGTSSIPATLATDISYPHDFILREARFHVLGDDPVSNEDLESIARYVEAKYGLAVTSGYTEMTIYFPDSGLAMFDIGEFDSLTFSGPDVTNVENLLDPGTYDWDLSGAPPVYGATAIDGRPGISFSVTEIGSVNMTGAGISAGDQVSLHVVGQRDADGAGLRMLCRIGSSGDGIRLPSTASQIQILDDGGTLAIGNWVTSTPFAAELFQFTAANKGRVNGGTLASSSDSGGVDASNPTITIGGETANGVPNTIGAVVIAKHTGTEAAATAEADDWLYNWVAQLFPSVQSELP